MDLVLRRNLPGKDFVLLAVVVVLPQLEFFHSPLWCLRPMKASTITEFYHNYFLLLTLSCFLTGSALVYRGHSLCPGDFYLFILSTCHIIIQQAFLKPVTKKTEDFLRVDKYPNVPQFTCFAYCNQFDKIFAIIISTCRNLLFVVKTDLPNIF